jgi:hypothetical protein
MTIELDLASSRARIRRLLWLYLGGALTIGVLQTLLIAVVVGVLTRARQQALQEVALEFAAPVDARPDLSDISTGWIVEQVQEVVESLPDPAPEMSPEQAELAVDVADSADDDELADDDDWLEALDDELEAERRLEGQWAEEDDAEADRWQAEQEEQDRAELEAWEAEQDRLADEAEALDAERREEIARIEQELDARVEDAAHRERVRAQHDSIEHVEGVEAAWAAQAGACPLCQAESGQSAHKARLHHPNCRCELEARPKASGSVNGELFEALSIDLLEKQLDTMAGMPDSPWKTKQTKRVKTRINVLTKENQA